MSRFLNHIGSFFPKLQKDFKIYDGEIFSEVYDGDFYKDIPYRKYINFDLRLPLHDAKYVRDFGAKADDNSINNARMINTTIEACHKNGGGIVVVYASLASEIPVKVGDEVVKGSVIGKVSNTAKSEASDGPHLHLEVLLDGDSVDPALYLDISEK